MARERRTSFCETMIGPFADVADLDIGIVGIVVIVGIVGTVGISLDVTRLANSW